MKHFFEQFKSDRTTENKAEKSEKNIFESVTENSREFDEQIAATRIYPPEYIREKWQIKDWKIGDTTIKAIGVAHVPETFIDFRQEVEKAIQESDLVVNEFAPEALGLYDKNSAARLQSIKSKFNDNYNLEQLRQAYLKHEREWNLGIFHHEVELLAAKYGKDMAVVDLSVPKDPEAFLQDGYLYAYGAEQIAERKAVLKRFGLLGAAVGLGAAGLSSLINDLMSKAEKPILEKKLSRRRFLQLGLMAGAAVIAGVTPKITETPPQTALKKEIEEKTEYDQLGIEKLRDPKIAESLQRLANLGYKKITLIYGSAHLKRIEEYLNEPGKTAKELSDATEIIEHYNPDSFRVYHLSPGENNSERFVASKEMAWRRIY